MKIIDDRKHPVFVKHHKLGELYLDSSDGDTDVYLLTYMSNKGYFFIELSTGNVATSVYESLADIDRVHKVDILVEGELIIRNAVTTEEE